MTDDHLEAVRADARAFVLGFIDLDTFDERLYLHAAQPRSNESADFELELAHILVGWDHGVWDQYALRHQVARALGESMPLAVSAFDQVYVCDFQKSLSNYMPIESDDDRIGPWEVSTEFEGRIEEGLMSLRSAHTHRGDRERSEGYFITSGRPLRDGDRMVALGMTSAMGDHGHVHTQSLWSTLAYDRDTVDRIDETESSFIASHYALAEENADLRRGVRSDVAGRRIAYQSLHVGRPSATFQAEDPSAFAFTFVGNFDAFAEGALGVGVEDTAVY